MPGVLSTPQWPSPHRRRIARFVLRCGLCRRGEVVGSRLQERLRQASMPVTLCAFRQGMRRCDAIRGRKVEDRRKEEEMTAPITLPPMDELTLTELRRRYEETTDAETRTRYQMLLLSLRGQTSSQIAQNVLRSQDTVVRVLKRFFTGGLDAVPRRTAPGRARTVTAARARRTA